MTVKKTESKSLATSETAAFKKQFSLFFKAMRSMVSQAIGYRVLCGKVMNEAKENLPHGEFEEWVEKNFNLPKSTQHRWREFSTLFLVEADALQKSHGVGLLADAKGLKKKPTIEAIMEIAPKVLEGKGEVQFMREMKALPALKPDGGFRPNAEMLAAWLAQHHPDLKGKGYDALPPEIQKAFRKQYRPPLPSAEELAQIDRDEWQAQADWFDRNLSQKSHASFGPEHLSEIEHIQKTLSDANHALLAYIAKLKKAKS